MVETVEEDFTVLRASLPGVLPGRAGRARRPAHGEVRRTRWRGACGSRSSGARGGRRWTGRTRSASGQPVYRRVHALFERFDFLVSPTLARPPLVGRPRPLRADLHRRRDRRLYPRRLVSLPCGPSISPVTRPSRCRAGGHRTACRSGSRSSVPGMPIAACSPWPRTSSASARARARCPSDLGPRVSEAP